MDSQHTKATIVNQIRTSLHNSPDVKERQDTGHTDGDLKVAPVGQSVGQSWQDHHCDAPETLHDAANQRPLSWQEELHGKNIAGGLQSLSNTQNK